MSLPADVEIAAAHHQWDEFLDEWPLERLRSMTLPEYSTAGDANCLTYWLESRLEGLGSIWGGSAFKFGIYGRKEQKDVEDEKGRAYSENYGWYSKYGASPEAAFEQVRSYVVDVVEAAHAGELERIDGIDLGPALKWKLAFLYQDRDAPLIVPIYSATHLRAALGQKARHLPQSALYRRLAEQRGEEDVFAYARQLWEQAQEKLNAERLSSDDAYQYLVERYGPRRAPTQRKAGFAAPNGRQMALDRSGNAVRLYLEPGPWLRPGVILRREYTEHDSRSSNLAAQAPAVATGKPAHLVQVESLAALEALCNAYDEGGAFLESNGMTDRSPPLNQILYGPPGTGKTYHTVNEALAILDPAYLAENENNRTALKQRFDELSEEGRIRFMTFHQSFSYEDFVEGIRAAPAAEQEEEGGAGGIAYRVESGVFAQLCEDAQRDKAFEAKVGVRENAQVWKISIEEASSSGETRRYCFKHGEARIGWPDVGDIRAESFTERAAKLGSNDRSSLTNFGRDIVPGDVLVCLGTRTQICAVGVVTGEYEYAEKAPPGVREDYVHKLPVRWLATDLSFDITPLNQGVGLTLKTVYPLTRISWSALQDALRNAGVALAGEQAAKGAVESKPYVLIIDEINRGNVSRIFGELITLIEESKRAGGPEELSAVLPYSKRSFRVPKNVHLIGTMNTADRSLAGLDIALRRRFVFKEMPPRPELLDGVEVKGIDIGRLLRVMNERIEMLLDRDHCLGHAYFMPLVADRRLERLELIFRNQVLPLLQEYFFEDWQRTQWVLNDHRKAAPDRFIYQRQQAAKALFGDDVSVSSHNLPWRINEKAFERPEAYLGIIDAVLAASSVAKESEGEPA